MAKNLESKYENISNRLKKISNELMSFEKENADILKKYDELQNESKKIYGEYRAIHKQVLIKKYNNCNHLMIRSHIERDYSYGGKSSATRTCLKCGLDEIVNDNYYYYGFISEDEAEAMKTYIKNNHFGYFDRSVASNEICDSELACAIYQKIKEINPDIDDDTAIKYWEIALENIRKKNITEEQKEHRAKRLSLHRDFKRWNSADVIDNHN